MSYHLSLFSRKPKSPPGDGRSPARRGASSSPLSPHSPFRSPCSSRRAPSPPTGRTASTAIIPDGGTTELPDLYGNVKELGPLNSNSTKIGVIHNDALPTLDLTNPNANVDLRRAWLDTERDTATTHDWLYFAWERDSNNGSGFIAYEFMKNPAPAGCAYDTATDAQLIANCNPWANRTAATS